MTPQDLARIRENPDFIQLVRRKQRLTWSLTFTMLVIYYGFVLLVAFAPGVLGQSLNGGVTSVGMLVGVERRLTRAVRPVRMCRLMRTVAS